MRIVWTVLLLAASAAVNARPLAAADREVGSRVTVDWPRGQVVIDATLELDGRVANVSKARALAEEEIRQRLPGILQEFLARLPLDSWQTVGERISQPDLPAADALQRFPGRIRASSLTPNLREVRLRCEVPLYGPGGVFEPFVTHTHPSPMRRVLGFAPSRPFTGLVIDARGLLPTVGSADPQPVRPALSIRLLGPRLEPVLELPMCDPQAVRGRGMAAYTDRYTDEGSELAFRERIGADPLRVMARGVYGRLATDLILPEEAVRALLAREENRALLRQGRILIVIDPQP